VPRSANLQRDHGHDADVLARAGDVENESCERNQIRPRRNRSLEQPSRCAAQSVTFACQPSSRYEEAKVRTGLRRPACTWLASCTGFQDLQQRSPELQKQVLRSGFECLSAHPLSDPGRTAGPPRRESVTVRGALPRFIASRMTLPAPRGLGMPSRPEAQPPSGRSRGTRNGMD
jgi:hypothetical protein